VAGVDEGAGLTAAKPKNRKDWTDQSTRFRAEFTASGSFGGTLKGYRATALSRDRRVRVMCKCSKDDWEKLKPAFDKVIESLGPGKAER